MSQAVSTVQFDTEAAKRQVIYYATKYRAVIFAVAMVVLFLAVSQIADAGTTQDEFSASAGKFEGWIKGNLGKAISFVALIIGAGISAFKKDGTVTAGNASGLNDGAAALVIMSADKAKALGIKPLAKITSYGSAGLDPAIMGYGAFYATKAALDKINLKAEDLDLIEANEAYASQSIAITRDLNLDINKVNVNGGAIALGHPIGASGARILVTLLHAMEKRDAKKGLATLCIGGGQGTALIVERE